MQRSIEQLPRVPVPCRPALASPDFACAEHWLSGPGGISSAVTQRYLLSHRERAAVGPDSRNTAIYRGAGRMYTCHLHDSTTSSGIKKVLCPRVLNNNEPIPHEGILASEEACPRSQAKRLDATQPGKLAV